MNESTTTVTIELVGVCIAIAAGFVHLLEAWPSPWVPAVWMGAVLVLFSGYRVATIVRQKYFPAPEPEAADQQAPSETGRADMPSLKWSAVHPNQPTESSKNQTPAGPLQVPGTDGDFSASEMATMGLPQIALGEASDDPTAFLAEEGLRPETDADISNPEDAPIPMFAESTMSMDERTLAMQAIEFGEDGAHSEGPTAPLSQVDVLEEAADRTEAMDPESIGRPPQPEGPTEPMKAVADQRRPANSQPKQDPSAQDRSAQDPSAQDPSAQDKPEKTQALDQDELHRRLGDADQGAKTQKNPAVSSPRKPFAKRPKKTDAPRVAASNDQPPATERAEPNQVQPSTDGVRMLDANKLRRLQQELEKQEKGDD